MERRLFLNEAWRLRYARGSSIPAPTRVLSAVPGCDPRDGYGVALARTARTSAESSVLVDTEKKAIRSSPIAVSPM